MIYVWFWVLLLLLILMVVMLVSLVVATLKGAPFVPMSQKRVKQMVKLAEVKPGERAIDLGSGDGRIVLALARAGARAEGYEIQPLLVWWSRWRAGVQGLSKKTLFKRQNLWSVDCTGAGVVTLYAFPSMMGRLEQKLQAELPTGARVVSMSFAFPTWQPVKEDRGMRVYVKA